MSDLEERDLVSAFAELTAPASTADYAERARLRSAPRAAWRPLPGRWRLGLTGIAVAASLAVVSGGVYVALRSHGGGATTSGAATPGAAAFAGGAAVHPNAAAAPPGAAPAISRAAAIAIATGGRPPDSAGVQSRLSTWADYELIAGAAAPLGGSATGRYTPVAATSVATGGEAPGALVWIVTVHGHVDPNAVLHVTALPAFDWYVEAIDATRGQPVALWAANGSWPPAGFSSLRDLGGP